MDYIDLHSHVIPYIDDGAKDLDTAVAMVEACTSQGIKTIVCTPHFRRLNEKSVLSFIEKRAEMLELLKSELKRRNMEVPDFRLGAEVCFDCDLSEIENIEKLAIEGTNYILIEMPDILWQNWVLDYLFNLYAQKNLIPIIAHVERYDQPKEIIEKLKRLEVYFQVNASMFLGKRELKKGLKMLKNNEIHFIASDSHNMSMRKPALANAFDVISRKLSPGVVKELNSNALKVINNGDLDKKNIEYYTEDANLGFFGLLFRKRRYK